MSSSAVSLPLADRAGNDHAVATTGSRPAGNSMSWLQSRTRGSVLSFLKRLQGGRIHYSDTRQTIICGDPHSDLNATWTIRDARVFSQLLRDGSRGFAESYLQGHWQTENLTALLRIFCRNLNTNTSHRMSLPDLLKSFRQLAFRLTHNTRCRSRSRIAAHYDLGNEFFELFLDPTLMYSCGWFEAPETSLHEASTAKLERICRKLSLGHDDNVLEIGTGWGGFALHAVKHFGCRLSTTTLSAAQFRKARQRIAAAGIADRVHLLNDDYRDLHGQYDKLVSIEMVEAVGEQYLDTYFRQCARLLKPGGRFLIQAIVMPEDRFSAYRRSVDFIQQYIFPGGFLPSVAAIQESVGRTSSLRLQSLEDLSEHYARTLLEWRRRYLERLDAVRALGFDERFIRMWEYYLCYCEAAFREQAVRVVQIVWDKPLTAPTS